MTALDEYRCDCGKLLGKGSQDQSVVEIKCKRCRQLCRFSNNNNFAIMEFNSLAELRSLVDQNSLISDLKGSLVLCQVDEDSDSKPD